MQIQSQVSYSQFYLDRYFPKGSWDFVEPAWVTHLIRTVIANFDVECVGRAKNTAQQNDTMDMNKYEKIQSQ